MATGESDTELHIAMNDSNGLSFPDLTLPANGVEVSWDGAASAILNVTGMEILVDISANPLAIRLTFDGTLPVAGTALTLMVPSGGTQTVMQMTTRPVWAARRDYRGRDFLRVSSSTDSLITIASTRFIVRAEGASVGHRRHLHRRRGRDPRPCKALARDRARALAGALDAELRVAMYACPRDCGGNVVADREGTTTCTLCARGEVLSSTADRPGSWRQEA